MSFHVINGEHVPWENDPLLQMLPAKVWFHIEAAALAMHNERPLRAERQREKAGYGGLLPEAAV